MRVFVTGASGFIGQAVVRELVSAGHEVTGLARSDKSAGIIEAAGASVHRGDINDPTSLATGASAADGTLHLAFNHDFSRMQQNAVDDGRVIAAMAEALAGSNRPLVTTSGVAVLPAGQLGTEDEGVATDGTGHFRGISESVLDFAARGVRAGVVRLAPSVHDAGDYGFIPMLIAKARETGVSAYIGTGDNRWSAVHRLDAARLYRLALERGEAGQRFHGVGEEAVPMRGIAETIAEGLGLPLRALDAEAGAAHFGWLARFVGQDMPTSNALTRQRLGWEPREIGLLADMRAHYFG